MNRTLRTVCLGWLLSLLCVTAFAFEEPATDQLQPIPALTGPVVDTTGTLAAPQREQLSQKLQALHDKYGAQMQVLVVPTTQPETAFDYSLRVVEKWQLGSKEKDDGLLLLIALNDRKTWIQTGYGLEGVIPDIVAKSLLRDTLAPHLRNGDFAGGINAVIDATFQRISGEVTALPEPKSRHASRQSKDNAPQWMTPLIIGAIFIAVLSNVIGGFLASGLGAAGVFFFIWLFIGTSLLVAAGVALVAIVLALFFRVGGYGGSGFGGGSFGGGSFGGGGGGWSGGGGGFGGGGAGGDW